MSRRERVQIRGAKKSFGSKGLAVGTAVQLSNAKSDAATKNCTAGAQCQWKIWWEKEKKTTAKTLVHFASSKRTHEEGIRAVAPEML